MTALRQRIAPVNPEVIAHFRGRALVGLQVGDRSFPLHLNPWLTRWWVAQLFRGLRRQRLPAA